MLGFVSALSSTVAILILVVTMSMLNSFTHILEEQEKSKSFTLSDGVLGNDDGTILDSISLQDSIIPINAISQITNDGTVNLTCTYGKNFSKEGADKFLTYNFIKLKANLPTDTDIKTHLTLDKENINNCRIGL